MLSLARCQHNPSRMTLHTGHGGASLAPYQAATVVLQPYWSWVESLLAPVAVASGSTSCKLRSLLHVTRMSSVHSAHKSAHMHLLMCTYMRMQSQTCQYRNDWYGKTS